MSTRFNELVIQTPEGVRFVHQLASPVSRLFALAVDQMVIGSIMSILSAAILLLQWVSVDFAVALSILIYFVLFIGYYIILEQIWRGQTLGKRLLHLRVMDGSGLRLRANQVILRNLLRFVDSLPFFYVVGGVCALLNRRSQRLGDLAAGTVVVRLPRSIEPIWSELGENRYNSFREHPRLEALLRQRISAETADIALQALRRREAMDPAARAKLYAQLVAAIRSQVTFPEELVSLMSDEQFVRNCVETLYPKSRRQSGVTDFA